MIGFVLPFVLTIVLADLPLLKDSTYGAHPGGWRDIAETLAGGCRDVGTAFSLVNLPATSSQPPANNR